MATAPHHRRTGQIIVSGDRKHLLPIVEYSGVRIVTPQALLAELANA
jgi:predicted nucleic acid-binding protein